MVTRRRKKLKQISSNHPPVKIRRQVIKEDEFIQYILLLFEQSLEGSIKIDVVSDARNFLVIPKHSFFDKSDVSEKYPYKDMVEKLNKDEAFINKHSRKSVYSLRRHACFHILRNYYQDVTYLSMAKDFNFNHTSILHACRNADNLLTIEYNRFLRIYEDCLAIFNIKVLPLESEQQQNSNDTVPTDIS